jgi:hypothetical protein
VASTVVASAPATWRFNDRTADVWATKRPGRAFIAATVFGIVASPVPIPCTTRMTTIVDSDVVSLK